MNTRYIVSWTGAASWSSSSRTSRPRPWMRWRPREGGSSSTGRSRHHNRPWSDEERDKEPLRRLSWDSNRHGRARRGGDGRCRGLRWRRRRGHGRNTDGDGGSASRPADVDRRGRGRAQSDRLGRLHRDGNDRRSMGDGFEKQTGCQVKVKYGKTSDEMVQLMRTGQYDGVSASGDATNRLIAAGDVAPINTDLIADYKDIFAGCSPRRTTRSTASPTACPTSGAPTSSSTGPTSSSRRPTAGASSWTAPATRAR